MNEFEITLTREEFLVSFGPTEEKLKNLEPLENIKKKDKLREELYQMLNDSENLKIYYDKNQEELTELLNTVKKISSDIESNYPEIEDTQIDQFIEITNFSWVSSIKLFLHFIPNDCFSRKFSGKININEISFKEDNKIDQATIDLYFPDKEEDFCVQGEPIIKHSLLYLFQFNNWNTIRNDYSFKGIEEIVNSEEKRLIENSDSTKKFNYQLDNYFKLAYTINFLLKGLNSENIRNSLKNQYEYCVKDYIDSNLKINYYWVDLDKIHYALNFLKNVIIKAKKEEKDKYEEKLKNLFGEEIEKLLGIQSNTNNYLYSIIKKIYPKYLDFRIRSIKLKVLKNVEQKEILRSLLKDRTIIQKKYDNGIIEFKADYFYNVKNKSIHKKYNDLYNNMIETAISNLILSLPEYF